VGGYAPARLSRSPPPTGFIEPCLPTPAAEVPGGPRWVHEIKHDGYRFIGRRESERVRVFNRHGRDWSDRVPLIVEALRTLPVGSVTLDGEGVVCDAKGLTDFDRLRTALSRRGSREVIELDGEDLRPRCWDERRGALARLLRKAGDGVRLSQHLDGGDGATVFRHACAMGLEGIVAKRRDRPYRSGRCADTRRPPCGTWNPDAPRWFPTAMAGTELTSGWKVPCEQCPLRAYEALRDFAPEELAFVRQFKCSELNVHAGTTLLLEGNNSAHLYTVLNGWAFRYKMLPDGRRQILNYVLPADFVGLQASMLNEMQHSVEALTDMMLCVFPREKLWDLYRNHPTLAFDVTWLAAREEKILDDHLLNVGRRTAIERIAFLLLHLFMRAEQVRLTKGNTLALPLTQQHMADTLGMSLVHLNKTLKRVVGTKTVRWKPKSLEILDREALARIATYDLVDRQARPFI